MSNMSEDFDPIAVVVDWLDACRQRDLAGLLDLYADDASLECACDSITLIHGRAALEAYWRPRLDAFVPTAFGLEEITPGADGVVLDYSSFEGKPVRISFAFSSDGKIRQTICGPAAGITGDDPADPDVPA
jgi:ketosteroid isomerase-like protein